MGESYLERKVGADSELVKLVSSASLACGFHGGDPLTMRETVALCLRSGVAVGAHPSFNDLDGFGRREMELPVDRLEAEVLYQISSLKGIVESMGSRLQHVKPHGALYNMAWSRKDYASAIVAAVKSVSRELILVVPPGSVIETTARAAGLRVAREGFPERGYLDDGRLAPRSMEGALIMDPRLAADRAEVMLSKGTTISVTGKAVSLAVDTLCIHSDTPGSPAIAGEIRRRLSLKGIEVRPLRDLIGGDRR